MTTTTDALDVDTLRAALLELTPPNKAAEALANGSTHADAADAANVARETVTRWAGHHSAFQAAVNLSRATLAAEQTDIARHIRGPCPRDRLSEHRRE